MDQSIEAMLFVMDISNETMPFVMDKSNEAMPFVMDKSNKAMPLVMDKSKSKKGLQYHNLLTNVYFSSYASYIQIAQIIANFSCALVN